MHVFKAVLLVTSSKYSPSTEWFSLIMRNGWHFFLSIDVCCGGFCVGRCKTEGVRLNTRFVSVPHDWHGNVSEKGIVETEPKLPDTTLHMTEIMILALIWIPFMTFDEEI